MVAKREPGAFGHVEQRMVAIGEVQDPQQRHLVVARGTLSAHRPIEPAPAELRLALRVATAINGIPFDDGDNAPQHRERMGEALGRSSERLSAELWYSGYSPLGVRIRQPTGRSKPGEQYCRSS